MVHRRDPYLALLILLTVIQLVWLAPRLVVSDLNLDYPFVGGDSHDWIANGLRLAGEDVRFSGRPPLLPLALALLERLGAMGWYPLLAHALFSATILAFYDLARRFHPRRAAFAAALALFVSHALLGLSLQVMADVPASCLLFLALRAFLVAGDRPRRYLASGFFGGLAGLAQVVGLLAVLPFAAAVALHRRPHLRSAWPWSGGALFLGLPGGWLAARSLGWLPADVPMAHWRFLSLHVDAVGFYLLATVSLLGLAGVIAIIAGAILAARRARREIDALLPLCLSTLLIGFFVFLYDYNAKRFLVYAVWSLGLLLAEALARIERTSLFAASAALVIATAALPSPGSVEEASWGALWPLPPVYVRSEMHAGPTGSPEVVGGSLALETLPLAEALAAGNLNRLSAAGTSRGSAGRLKPDAVSGDSSALFLYASDSDGGGRYRTITRLGNALRKRVKPVPAAFLEPYLDRLAVSRIGELAPDYSVFRARLPGLAATFLLTATSASPVEARLARACVPPKAGQSDLAGGIPRAQEIAAYAAGWDGYVAILPGGSDPAQLYLPFLLRSTEVYLPLPGGEEELAARLSRAPVLDARRFGDAEARRVEFLGRRATIVDFR